MENENTPETSGEQSTGFTEDAHIIVTGGFEAVLFPSGLLVTQGDNVVRLNPTEALAIAGAVMLGYSGDETTEEAS